MERRNASVLGETVTQIKLGKAKARNWESTGRPSRSKAVGTTKFKIREVSFWSVSLAHLLSSNWKL